MVQMLRRIAPAGHCLRHLLAEQTRQQDRAGAMVSYDVKRAIDYMRANFDAPLTIADLTAVAGVPARTLFKHFQDFCGKTPMQYLRDERFEQARRDLQQGRPGDCVSRIALEAGFAHLGRFAVEYRKRYGESPSQTLSRASGAHRLYGAANAERFLQVKTHPDMISAQGAGR